MRGLYKQMDGDMKMRIDRGDYLGAVRSAWKLAEGQPGHQEMGFRFDLQSSFLGFAGDDAGARLAMARSQHITPRPMPARASAEASRAARAEVKLEDPEVVLARVAETHQVIMISEAHHVPEHRAYGAYLLPMPVLHFYTFELNTTENLELHFPRELSAHVPCSGRLSGARVSRARLAPSANGLTATN